MGVKDEKINIMIVYAKTQCLGRGVYETPIYRGRLPKKGAWAVFRFKDLSGSALERKREVVFLRGWKGG